MEPSSCRKSAGDFFFSSQLRSLSICIWPFKCLHFGVTIQVSNQEADPIHNILRRCSSTSALDIIPKESLCNILKGYSQLHQYSQSHSWVHESDFFPIFFAMIGSYFPSIGLWIRTVEQSTPFTLITSSDFNSCTFSKCKPNSTILDVILIPPLNFAPASYIWTLR